MSGFASRVGFLVLLALVFASHGELGAQLSIISPDPEPFRADDEEIMGRDDDDEGEEFDKKAFILRHVYRFAADVNRAWLDNPSGMRAVAGSVNGDNFYAYADLRKRFEIPDTPFIAHFRYRRDEDFDGQYDRVRFGLGVKLGHGWEFNALSDGQSDKDELDVELEVQWRSVNGHMLRASFTMVDAVFNTKEAGGEYELSPFTYFAEARVVLPGSILIEPWINVNSNLRRRFDPGAFGDDQFDFTYRRFISGVRATVPIGELWEVEGLVMGETGNADRRYGAENPDERRLDRNHFRCDLEVRREVTNAFTWWLGYRYFRLSERERRPFSLDDDNDTQRREHVFKGGVLWQVHERVRLRPSLYLNAIDNEMAFDFAPELGDSDDETTALLSLPVDVALSDTAGLRAQINYVASDTSFGGGALSLHFPF